jgi:hypothetical protein
MKLVEFFGWFSESRCGDLQVFGRREDVLVLVSA